MISIIAAMAKNRVIGKDNKLPWSIPDDLKNFKKLTTGNTIIMGRKTFESIGKPLPNRNNIVVSSTMQPLNGVQVCKNIQEALEKAKSIGKEIFIIGGAQIYEQTIPIADKMFISHVKKEHEGDAHFPNFEINEWQAEQKNDYPEFELVVYTRKNGTTQKS